jgi:thioredoxin-like negative regulator of GroEL
VRAFPKRDSRNHRFRLAAFVGALLFALHGCFDVSAHRVGSAFAGILLLGAAMPRPLHRNTSRLAPLAFRAVAILLLTAGLSWLAAAQWQLALPGSLGAEMLRTQVVLANRARSFPTAVSLATRAMAWTPLDWQLYFLRAVALVNQNQPQPALADFRRARFLEPNAWEVPLEEGRVWATSQPPLALVAWREALRRAGRERAEAFRRMIRIAEQFNRNLLGPLEQLSHTHGDLVLAFIERLHQEPFQRAIDRLLDEDPDLHAVSKATRPAFFAMWSERGDLSRLLEEVEQHPDWMAFAWRGVAKYQAQQGDRRGAVELVMRFTPRPALPQINSSASVDELERTLAGDPANYAAGFALYQRQEADGRFDDALNTLRHFTEQRTAPAYFAYLESQAWARRSDWDRAWSAWQRYAAAVHL